MYAAVPHARGAAVLRTSATRSDVVAGACGNYDRTFAAISLWHQITWSRCCAVGIGGLVIDDAIVVREKYIRQMTRRDTADRGQPGTAQVALSVVAMSLTIIAVFCR